MNSEDESPRDRGRRLGAELTAWGAEVVEAPRIQALLGIEFSRQ